MEDKGKQKSNKDEKPIKVAKNAAELQKIRLEKLMSNPVGTFMLSLKAVSGLTAQYKPLSHIFATDCFCAL